MPVAADVETSEGVQTDETFEIEGPYDSVYRDFYKYERSGLIFTESSLGALSSTLNYLLKAWSSGQDPIRQLFVYWIVDQSNIVRYKWLLEEIQTIEIEIASRRRENRLSVEFQLELNIYVENAVPLGDRTPPPSRLRGVVFEPFGTTEMLEEILTPRVDSDQQFLLQKPSSVASNRLQDVWIWQGRPVMAQIFRRYQLNHIAYQGPSELGNEIREFCQEEKKINVVIN